MYIWDETKGLFKINFLFTNKVTRDYPPWAITDVKLEFVSSNLEAFELLYNKETK